MSDERRNEIRNEIRNAAEDMIQMLELNKYRGVNTSLDMEVTTEFKALKASIRPTREEIADYLYAYEFDGSHKTTPEIHTKMFNYAIEELRK